MLSSAQSWRKRSRRALECSGPLPFVAVRQQHHQAAHALPLRVRRGDELVDDHLRAVREVAELRLPERERGRVGEAVAVLEAEHRGLGELAVVDLEARLRLGQVVERRVLLAGLLVDEHGVALAEGAARLSWPESRTGVPSTRSVPKASASAMRPVDRPALGDHLAAPLEQRVRASGAPRSRRAPPPSALRDLREPLDRARRSRAASPGACRVEARPRRRAARRARRARAAAS